MDKLMVRVGLSGKSFIPLLSSFACAIPGVMATRVIENRRDRLTTILGGAADELLGPVAGVCAVDWGIHSAAALFVHGILGLQGLTLFAMYLVGPTDGGVCGPGA